MRVLKAETASQKIYWDADNQIVWAEMEPVRHTLEHAKQNVAAQAKLRDELGVAQTVVLVDMRNVGKMEGKARSYYASAEPAAVQRAAALVIGSAFGAKMANFFMKLSKPTSPTRMFTNTDAAIEWLAQFDRS